jgi:hypothetical protein
MKQSAHHPKRIVDHVHAIRLGPTVLMAWDVSGDAPAWVRILRSPADSASGVDDYQLARFEQTLVYEGDLTEVRDDDTIASAPRYYYTVFARDAEGVWHEQVDVVLQPSTETHWARDEEIAPGPAAERFAELRQGLPGA